VGWEEWGTKGAHRGVLTTMNDVVVRRLVAMSLMATWHLDLLSEKLMGGGKLSHLGSPLPVSVRRCWPSFVSRSFAFVLGLSSSFGVVGPGGCCG